MVKNNYVLGGGIAGLIFTYFNKNLILISKDIGGQFNNNFDLGPRFFHNSYFSRKLLKELNIPIRKEKIKVGYSRFLNNIEIEKPEGFKEIYFEKSRGEKYLDGKIVMTENKNDIRVFWRKINI